MNTIDLTPVQLTAIQRWAEVTPEVSHVVLFGSRARGTSQTDSDIDLGILTKGSDADGRQVSFDLHKAQWADELQRMVGLEIDLEYALEEHVADHIAAGHAVLYEKP